MLGKIVARIENIMIEDHSPGLAMLGREVVEVSRFLPSSIWLSWARASSASRMRWRRRGAG
jgi:hypothetical protein